MQDLLREELAELLKLSGSSFKVELIMRLLGLTHARNTMIGSAMVRRQDRVLSANRTAGGLLAWHHCVSSLCSRRLW